jgi:lipooligosaccharide transport system ATP-binding protein
MISERSAPPIRIEGVSKAYGNGNVVSGVTFSVERGLCFGLLGPNGAGKTTVLKMIYGFLRPSEGSVLVEGLDVVRHPREVRRRLGIAPQEDVLDPDLSVTQNLLFHARYSGISAPEARRRTDELLDSMGLGDHADAALGHLSTGLRRRLVLARALLNNPAIVVLDEPTRGLDRESRRRYVDVLQEMKKRGVTLMLATHELTEAEALCDRVALMEDGRILAEGSPREILPLKETARIREKAQREAEG